MPHHIEDDDSVDSQPGRVTPDSQSRSLCTGSDASRFESVVSDKEGTSSDVHLMRHVSKNTHNLDEQMILLLSQVSWVGMLGTTLDYFRPNRTTCNHNRSFPQKREWYDTVFQVSLQKITTKWWSGRSSMAIIPGLEKYNFLLLLQSFRLWIPTGTALDTSRLCRYYTRTSFLIRKVSCQRGGINEGCISLICWV